MSVRTAEHWWWGEVNGGTIRVHVWTTVHIGILVRVTINYYVVPLCLQLRELSLALRTLPGVMS